ncbi:hypothetical protein K503DRAFT_435382 [Rhizopogon vinicolor AM-OR11-026]|uniref:Uncharacterized protein n=1 Tax=Rhizopogon vinicolor AM-OR11-026 TaxID=1314800 RepID=A0A1B7MPN3_9AGAM|nr:hypothetical protein K503DRAFT_435382 [Rhizopogon vinicolor AM-OR11-026]
MPSNNKGNTSFISLDARAGTAFAAARTENTKLVEDANSYADSVQTALVRMREQREANRCDLLAQVKVDEEKIQALCAAYSSLLDGVVHQRAQTIHTTKVMVQESEIEMRKSRKRLMEKTKARLDDARERQKLTMDATALVKHYKALILTL